MKKITAIRSASKQKKQQKLLLDVAMHNMYVHTCPETSTNNSPLSPNIANHKPYFYSTRSAQKTVIQQHQTQKITANKDAQNTQDLSPNPSRKIDRFSTSCGMTSKEIFKRCYSITRKQCALISDLYSKNDKYEKLTADDYLFLMQNRKISLIAEKIESICLSQAPESSLSLRRIIYRHYKSKERTTLKIVSNNKKFKEVAHTQTKTQHRLVAV